MVLDKTTLKATILHKKIRNNTELETYEAVGFIKGAEKGKTMNVPFRVIAKSLEKQWKDWQKVRLSSKPALMKTALADLRNVSACAFLKLQELEQK